MAAIALAVQLRGDFRFTIAGKQGVEGEVGGEGAGTEGSAEVQL